MCRDPQSPTVFPKPNGGTLWVTSGETEVEQGKSNQLVIEINRLNPAGIRLTRRTFWSTGYVIIRLHQNPASRH